MKMSSVLRNRLLIALTVACTASFQSCLDDNDDDYRFPNALVTAKTDADNTFYLQLDEETTLLPTNLSASPFGDKEVRALVNFTEVENPGTKYSKAVHVNWIDSILTKPIAPDLGEENDEVYGTDPVEIINDWVTIAEDGYLTLRFRTVWGNWSKPHFVNLLLTRNSDNHYEVEFRHNAYGDLYGEPQDALVAFKLEGLPEPEGETGKLTLKWKSFSGDKSAEFEYRGQQSSTPQNPALTSIRNNLNLK